MAYVNCLLSIACCTKVYMLQCVLGLAFPIFMQLNILVAVGQHVQTIISWDLGEQLVETVNGLKTQDWMVYVSCLLSIICGTRIYMC
jgi:branched-subunit amino acid transport protein AzlD